MFETSAVTTEKFCFYCKNIEWLQTAKCLAWAGPCPEEVDREEEGKASKRRRISKDLRREKNNPWNANTDHCTSEYGTYTDTVDTESTKEEEEKQKEIQIKIVF